MYSLSCLPCSFITDHLQLLPGDSGGAELWPQRLYKPTKLKIHILWPFTEKQFADPWCRLHPELRLGNRIKLRVFKRTALRPCRQLYWHKLVRVSKRLIWKPEPPDFLSFTGVSLILNSQLQAVLPPHLSLFPSICHNLWVFPWPGNFSKKAFPGPACARLPHHTVLTGTRVWVLHMHTPTHGVTSKLKG